MPKGLIHSQKTRFKISETARKTAQQSNAGFRQRVECEHCGQSMSPANLGKHHDRCEATRGMVLNGHELSVKEIKNLRRVLKPTGWSVEQYIQAYNKQQGACAVCNSTPTRRRLSADHCHMSGKPRGLLCERCNMALGLFIDDCATILRAAEYVQHYRTAG